MKRLRILLLAYLAAALAGGAAFSAAVLLLDDGPFPGMGVVLFLPVLTGGVGGVLALPLAAAVILAAERWRRGPWWLFLGAGLLLGGMLCAIPLVLGDAQVSEFMVAAMAAALAGAMAFWLIAWHRNPPRLPIEPLREVFE